jgi:hypothetical protein
VWRQFPERAVGYRIAAITALQVALGVAVIFAQRAWMR